MSVMASHITSLTVVSFIHAQIKENMKAPRHWPLCGELTGDRWIPHTKGQQRGKCFHLMTSSLKWTNKISSCDHQCIKCLKLRKLSINNLKQETTTVHRYYFVQYSQHCVRTSACMTHVDFWNIISYTMGRTLLWRLFCWLYCHFWWK